jgi:hypothetical protein
MAPLTPLVLPGSRRHNDGRPHRITQADQTVGEAGDAVELLNLRFQVAQLIERPLQVRRSVPSAGAR